MNVLLLSQYYLPEQVGIGVQLHQLATDLQAKGHRVTVLTTFPNYPDGIIPPPYRGRRYQRETVEGIEVIRTWIYATPSKRTWPRVANFGSFCATSLAGGILATRRADVVYAILPPLPLGITALSIARARRARVVVNIQDIYPYAAIALGVLRNPRLIRFFERMERYIYRRADHIAVISAGFKENIESKGVPADKVSVVPNWADPGVIRPGPRENGFRREMGVGDRFTLIYSGSLSHNSNLEPVLDAADRLRNEPFAFVIVGDGVRKPDLQRMAGERKLDNLQFKSFQPLERYPEVLQAADMNLVTLNTQATLVSVPSKIFKQMAAARPVLAITAEGNELYRLVHAADCGVCVPPDDGAALAAALTRVAADPAGRERMGDNARRYLLQHHSREGCIAEIESILKAVVTP